MDVKLEVLVADGWTNYTFSDVESIRVAGAPGTEGLEFTLIGEREGAQNQVVTEILDIASRHEEIIENSVPRTDSGKSIPVAYRDDSSDLSGNSETGGDTG